ncbi:MAG: phosphatase PAP2 family protein [Clostridia bacterium]|nr:phosphatase PAP2 family protein [Clostridia bacterium]
MRRPMVDYRGFRLRRINEPQFSHLKLLLGWVGYFILYFLTENLIPAERCYPVHCTLDDVIPFCEYFLIPYVFWYALIVISLGYFLLYDVERFRQLQTFIIVTQVVAMACYILFPTRQDLRPAEFSRENLLTWGTGLLYQLDTNTGVCPSLHVAYSLGIASVWCKQKTTSVLWRGFVIFAVVLICLSTMFLKQHSAIDVLAAIPTALLAEWFVFRRRPKKS